ncbi:DUF2726 domain-containing protein [Dyadobacter sp. LJ53]|uniref:DUF2726 domain-containing protein n=1 Tax=Dyadobacter chenwenxiniae TaxID=2906456 RepID=UPI001F43FE5D|nr:DUF2726 domain-containing protein [Dyadobacter chenwenxiniae]MCF0049264.1 DUF2726 domain-containing protein [Dyadobacter chenwenxiniae]
MAFNREDTFILLRQRNWGALINLFKNNKMYREIQEDTIAKTVLDRDFIHELIEGNGFEEDADYFAYLEDFHLLHVGSNYDFRLTNAALTILVEKIITNYRPTRFDAALAYARRYPNMSVSVEVLGDFEKSQPKVVQHSQAKTIHVTENKEIELIDGTTSIFKSGQEYQFYLAVRSVYSSYLVFPNVAVSSIINFDLVKDNLDQNEKSYFFKALVDCVVIDPENGFKPFKMFEIDSDYHDGPKQQTNDRMKDKIMGKAGQKLFHIRVKGKGNMLKHDLKQLILEVIRQ